MIRSTLLEFFFIIAAQVVVAQEGLMQFRKDTNRRLVFCQLVDLAGP
jgi:hypothetical protein